MYEFFRNDIIANMGEFNDDVSARFLAILDKVSAGYEIKKRETALSIPSEDVPRVLKIYLVAKKMEGLSEQTLSGYKLILANCLSKIAKPLEEIKPNDLRMYMIWYQSEHPVQLGTLEKYRQYICRFFKWACNEGYLSSDPASNLKAIRAEKKQRRALTQAELEQLRDACITPREAAILEVLYSTGCRVSELCNLTLEDVNWCDSTVHLYGKGRKHRTSYLNPKSVLMLKKYLSTRDDDCTALIVTERAPARPLKKASVEAIFGKMVDRAFGPDHDKITPHSIRHTTATTALQRGMPITDISALLGHENVGTTMIYAKTSEEEVKRNHLRCIV